MKLARQTVKAKNKVLILKVRRKSVYAFKLKFLLATVALNFGRQRQVGL